MSFKYESVVPWGRSYSEYRAMFGLTDADLDKKILGCGDGPAEFNSVMAKNGKSAVSADPIYRMRADEIAKRIDETYGYVIGQTRMNRDKFIWTNIRDVEELGRIRMSAMRAFLDDYERGKAEKRYIPAELPELPFEDNAFDIALSSHFLFLYTDNLDLEFHLRAIAEMMRVAREARIFPLLDVNAVKSPYVESVTREFGGKGYTVEDIRVDYEFQKGGNRMLKITGNE